MKTHILKLKYRKKKKKNTQNPTTLFSNDILKSVTEKNINNQRSKDTINMRKRGEK